MQHLGHEGWLALSGLRQSPWHAGEVSDPVDNLLDIRGDGDRGLHAETG